MVLQDASLQTEDVQVFSARAEQADPSTVPVVGPGHHEELVEMAIT